MDTAGRAMEAIAWKADRSAAKLASACVLVVRPSRSLGDMKQWMDPLYAQTTSSTLLLAKAHLSLWVSSITSPPQYAQLTA